MMEIRVRLEWSKTTKNTFMYSAQKGAAITTLYVQKDAMPGQDPPPAIIVTVTADE